MNSLNSRFEYGLATEQDAAEILEIFEILDFKGEISVSFTRRPDPVESLNNDGQRAIIPIIRDKETKKICAVGCCVVREAFVNGKVVRTGYLTGLKVRPEYRKHRLNIPQVYADLYELTKEEVDIYYTTILKENTQAQRLLEKRHKNMPEYLYRGEYTVYCFTNGSVHSNEFLFEKGNTLGLDKFFEQQLPHCNFAVNNQNLYGLSDRDFYTLRDQKGEIVAACAVWNQQSYKQYIITGYEGIYRYLRFLPTKPFGYPNIPKVNIPVNYASIAMLCVRENNLHGAEYLLKKVAQDTPSYDFLMLGLHENHPLNLAFRRIKHIAYQSRVYIVQWQDDQSQLDERPLYLEVGLL